MELIIYNKTCAGSKVTEPAIRLTKQGVVYFNLAALELMGLEEGNTVSFAQDKAKTKDWYMAKDAEGLPLKPKSGKDKTTGKPSLGIASAVIVSKLRISLNLSASKNYSIGLAKEPTIENDKSYYALITSKIE